MIPVILVSPYTGDVEGNIKYARACMHDCISKGESPLAPHLLFTQVLDDVTPEQRELGLSLGAAWVARAVKVVVYGDKDISEGMAYEIREANRLGKPVEYRLLFGDDDKPVIHNLTPEYPWTPGI